MANRNVYSVTDVNKYIKRMFVEDFFLNRLCVKGEVSNCKYHQSGHIYFTLKDGSSLLSVVMFSGNRGGLKFKLSEGQQVVVTGRIDIYERDGKYQMYANEITLDGDGDLYRKFEELKKQLADMGMFDSSYKKPIPAYSMRIGIVTASTGAAIQDIINISTRRNPYVQLYLYSAKVQGEGAAIDIANGIRYLDEVIKPDVMIVGRGGGSIEDLWAFNEEIVARAIFESNTPIISAVGHETDTTIADYVSDLRAPTPSAAAELAVFDYAKFINDLDNYTYSFQSRINNIFDNKNTKLDNYILRLKNKSPENILNNKFLYLDKIQDKLRSLINSKFDKANNEFLIKCEKLNGLSPLNRISRGYGYITSNDKSVKSVKDIEVNDEITVRINDGKIIATVNNVEDMR